MISLPFGVHATENRARRPFEEALTLLDSAEECSRAAVALLQHRGFSANFRESILTLVDVLALKETLGNGPLSAASDAAFLLGKSFQHFMVITK